MKKNKIILVIMCILSFVLLVACTNNKETSEKGIILDNSKITIDEGNSFQLNVTGDNVDGIEWSSNDESIATVTNGLVYGVSAGKAIITAKSNDYYATCKVIVEEPKLLNVINLALNVYETTLAKGTTFTLTLTLKSGTETLPLSDVSWNSSAPTVATVMEGVVTAQDIGLAEIIATVNYKGTSYNAKCTVKVIKIQAHIYTSINKNQYYKGDEIALSPFIMEGDKEINTDTGTFFWESTDNTIAKIENGILMFLKKGTVNISASYTLNGELLKTEKTIRVRETYSVKFYSEGNLIKTEEVDDGESANAVTSPELEGYIFKGWANGENNYNFDDCVQENLELNAQWYVQDYKLISYDKNTQGMSQNWLMNLLVKKIEYTSETAHGNETGSTVAHVGYSSTYPNSPCEMTLANVDFSKHIEVFFYVKTSAVYNLFFNGMKWYVSAVDTWAQFLIKSNGDGTVDVYVNGILYGDNLAWTNLKDRNFCTFKAGEETDCDVYFSAVYGAFDYMSEYKNLINALPQDIEVTLPINKTEQISADFAGIKASIDSINKYVDSFFTDYEKNNFVESESLISLRNTVNGILSETYMKVVEYKSDSVVDCGVTMTDKNGGNFLDASSNDITGGDSGIEDNGVKIFTQSTKFENCIYVVELPIDIRDYSKILFRIRTNRANTKATMGGYTFNMGTANTNYNVNIELIDGTYYSYFESDITNKRALDTETVNGNKGIIILLDSSAYQLYSQVEISPIYAMYKLANMGEFVKSADFSQNGDKISVSRSDGKTTNIAYGKNDINDLYDDLIIWTQGASDRIYNINMPLITLSKYSEVSFSIKHNYVGDTIKVNGTKVLTTGAAGTISTFKIIYDEDEEVYYGYFVGNESVKCSFTTEQVAGNEAIVLQLTCGSDSTYAQIYISSVWACKK